MGEKKSFTEWFMERTGLNELPFYRVPYSYLNINMWLGALIVAAMVWLFITGLLLLFYYNTSQPYDSTMKIVNEIPYGKILLSSHLYAAFTMILTMYLHLFKNYFEGVYKKPRELTWIIGVLLAIFTLQTAFFGYVLVGDIVATDAVNVGKGVIRGIFGDRIGTLLANLAFGSTPQETYIRVLALHILFAGSLALLFGLHFGLFEIHGPTPHPKETRWKIFPARIKKDRKDLAPWFPVNFLYMSALMVGVWALILLFNSLALSAQNLHPLISPLPGPSPDSPEAAKHAPYPPWFFLFFYKIADFVFLSINEPITLNLGFTKLTLPATPVLIQAVISLVLPVLYLISLPFIDKSEERHPIKRPIITAIGGLLIVYMVQTTFWAVFTPGQPIRIPQAIVVLGPPAILMFGGMYLLSKRTLVSVNSIGKTLTVAILGSLLLFFNSLTVFAQALTGSHSTIGKIEVSLSLGGIIISVAFLGAMSRLAKKLRENQVSNEENKKEIEIEQTENKSNNTTVPEWMIILATIYVFTIIAAALIIPTLDPIAYANRIEGLMSGVLFGIYGLLMILYRLSTMKAMPIKMELREARPHILVALGYIIIAVIQTL